MTKPTDRGEKAHLLLGSGSRFSPERDAVEELVAERASQNRVKLPLIRCHHEAPPGEELTPEKVAEILLEEDVKGRV